MSKLIAISISVCLLYFLVGGGLFALSIIDWQTYTTIGGMVGGLASVLGLLSLSRPVISQGDLDKIESDSLRSLAETAERIKELDASRTAAQQELNSLEIQKKEMELLVEKASLSLFLKEQRRLYEEQIANDVRGNHELNARVKELTLN